MKLIISCLVLGLSLVACVSGPTGPTIAVMPAQGKPFDVFQQDDQVCRQFAQTSSKATSEEGVKSAAKDAGLGAAVGAIAGAVIGGGSHAGVGTGAGAGLLAGALGGALSSYSSDKTAQTQYNVAYQQCMYAKGNQVPSASNLSKKGY